MQSTPIVCHTVGWIAYEDETCVKVYGTYNSADLVIDTSILLKAEIQSRQVLRRR